MKVICWVGAEAKQFLPRFANTITTMLVQTKFYLLLLVVSCSTFVESVTKHKPMIVAKAESVFSDLKKNHDNLRKFMEDIFRGKENEEENNYAEDHLIEGADASRNEECQCMPFYLCDLKTGGQISDGRYLLESRYNQFVCSNPTEYCCPKNTSQELKASSYSRCGYGYSSNTTQQSPDDDPTLSNFGQFPWTVMITRQQMYTCVGSLIHPRVVLTAAHCVNTPDEFNVRAGEWNTKTKTEPFRHQSRKVKDVINHPKFRINTLTYDVALLIMEEEFRLQENVNTICLTNAVPDSLIPRSEECAATGWGTDRPNGRYSRIMKKLDFSVTDNEQCQQALRSTSFGSKLQLNESFICAYGRDGFGVCQGNDGAPLMCATSKQPTRHQQVGIVPWGIGCAEGLSVFTKISQIRDWIDKVFDSLGYSKEYYTE